MSWRARFPALRVPGLLQMEPGGGHSCFELRGISEATWIQDKIAVGGVGGNGKLGGAGVEVDGLCASQDYGVAVRGERGQRVE